MRPQPEPIQPPPTHAQPAAKRPRWLPWALAAGGVVVLALCATSAIGLVGAGDVEAPRKISSVASPSPTPSPSEDTPSPEPTGPDSADLGATFTVTANDGTEAEYTAVKTIIKSVDELDTRASRGTYLLVYVKVSVESGSDFVCSCSFQFVTSSGKAYEAHAIGFNGLEMLESADLAGGQNTDGWVAFDVPKREVRTGRIAFKPDTFDGEVAYWRL